MQSGPSRDLLEMWAPDSRNGVIVTGYSVEGTMARVSVVQIVHRLIVYLLYVLSMIQHRPFCMF